MADVLRALAFLIVMSADSLPVMIVGALVAGIGTALFTPAALAGLPRLVDGDEGKAAAMGLYGAIDDIGLTAGPALAALGLAVVSPATLIGHQRRHVRDLGRADRIGRRARQRRR